MSIYFPPELQWLAYLTGSEWPKGDEDAMFRIGDDWRASADELAALIPDLERVRRETAETLFGDTAKAAEDQFKQLFDGEYSVDKLVEAMSALGSFARKTGTEIEYSKISVISSLAIAAAEILYALAAAPFTFGGSLAAIPAVEALTWAAIRLILSQVARRLAAAAVSTFTKTGVRRLVREATQEVMIGLSQDVGIQGYQQSKGHRDEIDWSQAGKVAGGAAVGGATGAGAHRGISAGLGGANSAIGGAFKGAISGYGAGAVGNVFGTLATGGDLDAVSVFGGGATSGITGGIHGASHAAGVPTAGGANIHLGVVPTPAPEALPSTFTSKEPGVQSDADADAAPPRNDKGGGSPHDAPRTSPTPGDGSGPTTRASGGEGGGGRTGAPEVDEDSFGGRADTSASVTDHRDTTPVNGSVPPEATTGQLNSPDDDERSVQGPQTQPSASMPTPEGDPVDTAPSAPNTTMAAAQPDSVASADTTAAETSPPNSSAVDGIVADAGEADTTVTATSAPDTTITDIGTPATRFADINTEGVPTSDVDASHTGATAPAASHPDTVGVTGANPSTPSTAISDGTTPTAVPNTNAQVLGVQPMIGPAVSGPNVMGPNVSETTQTSSVTHSPTSRAAVPSDTNVPSTNMPPAMTSIPSPSPGSPPDTPAAGMPTAYIAAEVAGTPSARSIEPAAIGPAIPPAPPVGVPSTTGPRVGAPPAPSAPVGPRKTDVINDESWRHDSARTADWFAPRDPAPEGSWLARRDDAHVATVDTVVADVLTSSTPGRIDAYDGLVRYDLRRIEVSPGRFVQEYTLNVHLRPGADVDPTTLADVAAKARQGVDDLLNQGFRLPSGDQFHLNLQFKNTANGAHTVVEVGHGGTDQTHWNPTAKASVLAHETLHYLGVPDEYGDANRVFLQHDTNSGVHRNDGGMMGRDVLGNDPGLRPRHLWLVERAANSQVAVPDTRLDNQRRGLIATTTSSAQHVNAAVDVDGLAQVVATPDTQLPGLREVGGAPTESDLVDGTRLADDFAQRVTHQVRPAPKRKVDDGGDEVAGSGKRARVANGQPAFDGKRRAALTRVGSLPNDVSRDRSGVDRSAPMPESVMDVVADDTLGDPIRSELTPEQALAGDKAALRLEELYSPSHIGAIRSEAAQMGPEGKEIVERAVAEFEAPIEATPADAVDGRQDRPQIDLAPLMDHDFDGDDSLPPLSVDFLDIGMGDSTLFVAADGTTVMIDLGAARTKVPARDGLTFLKNRLEELRLLRGISAPRIDRFYLTHADQDHYNLVPSLFDLVPNLAVGEFHVGGNRDEYVEVLNAFDSPHKLLDMQAILARHAVTTYHVDFPGEPAPSLVTKDLGPGTLVSFQVLGASAVKKHSGETARNASSIVVLVEKVAAEDGVPPLRILMMGDGEKTVENGILARHEELVTGVDLLHIGHHGSQIAASAKFLAVTNPRVAQVSADQHWAHPYASTIGRVTGNPNLRVNEAMANDTRRSIVVGRGLGKGNGNEHEQIQTTSALLANLPKQVPDTTDSKEVRKAQEQGASPMVALGQQWNVTFNADNSFRPLSTMDDQNDDTDFLPGRRTPSQDVPRPDAQQDPRKGRRVPRRRQK